MMVQQPQSRTATTPAAAVPANNFPDIELQTSEGWSVRFDQLLGWFNVVDLDRYDSLTAQFAAMQAQIDAHTASVQRQIDDLRALIQSGTR